MTALLTIHDDEEHSDVIEWLDSHRNEKDYPLHTDTACDWLTAIKPVGYPHLVVPPAELVEPLLFAIADWRGVLSCHDEELHTNIEVSQT